MVKSLETAPVAAGVRMDRDATEAGRIQICRPTQSSMWWF
jgi:hypothetical protein